MKNSDIIKKAWAEFNAGDLTACQKTLDRINKNFTLESDEFSISLRAELTQPLRKIAEKLISENKSELVGDAKYIAFGGYLRHDLTVHIQFRAISPYAITEDDDEEQYHYCAGHISLDNTGEIWGITSNGGAKAKYWRDEIKRLANEWLDAEFGKIKEW